jgi:toxin ParE1/3/4
VTAKPVLRRRSALRDTEERVIYYSREAGFDVANRFIDGLEAAYRIIGEGPGLGSPRHGHALGMPGLRSRLVRRFPYLIFYREHEVHIEILRILYARSNVDESSFTDLEA